MEQQKHSVVSQFKEYYFKSGNGLENQLAITIYIDILQNATKYLSEHVEQFLEHVITGNSAREISHIPIQDSGKYLYLLQSIYCKVDWSKGTDYFLTVIPSGIDDTRDEEGYVPSLGLICKDPETGEYAGIGFTFSPTDQETGCIMTHAIGLKSRLPITNTVFIKDILSTINQWTKYLRNKIQYYETVHK